MTDKADTEVAETAIDLLFGAGAVAGAIGLSRRQVYHAAENGYMPLFKIGTTICGRRSTLARWFSEREALSDSAPNFNGDDRFTHED